MIQTFQFALAISCAKPFDISLELTCCLKNEKAEQSYKGKNAEVMHKTVCQKK